MSSASHCEIERDLGNPYSVELATGMFGFKKKTDPKKWVARAGERAAEQASSGGAASDGHGGWLQEAHSDIQKLKDEADQKHAQEQAHIKEKHAQAHANITEKQALLKTAEKLHREHAHAMNEHTKMEAEKQKVLNQHEILVQGAHAKSNAALKAAEDAKNAFMGTSHHNAEASSDTGHDSSHWDDVHGHVNLYNGNYTGNSGPTPPPRPSLTRHQVQSPFAADRHSRGF